MDANRWRQVDQLYHAALELPTEDRQRFIARACEGDPDLRGELESLLAHDLAADSASLLDDANITRLEPGAQLGPYQIESRIGAGGMGEVYKARDTRLGRFVAIKVLAATVADPVRKQRFLQEARAASALNHPNIVTIHDIVTQGTTDCLVMEYVPGKTLEQAIPRKGLRLSELLHYAVQISDALAAAHAAGIVHRDIKPSNVMITNEGVVKVLDFGLAKLVEQETPGSEDPTRTAQTRTEEGKVVGSVPYMSPEQAEGKPVDARTDIFSLGAVLYEMCTGQRPFQGGSRAGTLAELIAKDPPPIDQLTPGVPAELERTILRCLRKDPNRRFQSMLDLKLTLEELKIESDSGRLPASPALPQVRTRHGRKVALAAVAVVLAAAAGWMWWRFHSGPPLRALPFERLTFDSGLTTDPAISLDGKLIAYASDRAGEGSLDIWVQYRGGEPVRITHSPADEYQPSFSPDGMQIVYRSAQDGGGIYVVSSLGGGEPRLVARGGDWPRFSPDGTEILFANSIRSSAPLAYTVNVAVSGAPRKQLAPEFAAVATPVWSPDGQYILFIGTRSGDKFPSPWIVPRNGGAAEPVRYEFSVEMTQVRDAALDAWLPGDHMIAELEIRGQTHLWQAKLRRNPWRLAEIEEITVGTGSAKSASVAQDGTIVASNEETDLDLWSIPLDADLGKVIGEPRRLTQDAAREGYPSISLEGNRLAYSSEQLSASHIWLMDLPSGVRRMLTSSSSFDLRPAISRDGTQVAYMSGDMTSLAASCWVIASSGGTAQKVKNANSIIWDWSSDGRSLLVLSGWRQPVGVDLIDLATGSPSPFLRRSHSVYQSHISHDGYWAIAQEPGGAGVLIAPVLDGKPPADDLWQPIGMKGADLVRWSPNDNLIYFISSRDSFRCIWAQRLDPHTKRISGEPFAIAHFHQARRSLRISDSGKVGLAVARNQIVVAEAERTGNIWTAKLGR